MSRGSKRFVGSHVLKHVWDLASVLLLHFCFGSWEVRRGVDESFPFSVLKLCPQVIGNF